MKSHEQNQFLIVRSSKSLQRNRKKYSYAGKEPLLVEYVDQDSGFINNPYHLPYGNHKKALSVEVPKIRLEVQEGILANNDRNKPKKPFQCPKPSPLIKINHSYQLDPTSPRQAKAQSPLITTRKNIQKKYKLRPINLPDKQVNLLVNGTSSKLNKIADEGFYYKLLEFFIKINIEYSPVFNKIDAEKNLFITLNEIKQYFSRTFSGSINEVNNFVRFVHFIAKSAQIPKNCFLAACAIVRYESPMGDSKAVLMYSDYSNIMSLYQLLQVIYCSISSDGPCTIEKLISAYSISENENVLKCFAFICSEPVDFFRFLRVFPLFLWLNPKDNN